MIERYIPLLKSFVPASCAQLTREPSGVLHHPFIVPTTPESAYYTMSLWDWDSWFVSVALGQVEADTEQLGKFMTYEQGCVRNFLEHTDDAGAMPIMLGPDGPMERGSSPTETQNMHKPVLAQHAALLTVRQGDVDWIKTQLDDLGRFLDRYLSSHTDKATGLAYWQSDFAIGVDNDPSVYYRPDKSCGSIYLNCLLYRELLAYGYLLELLGRVDEANQWRDRASDLADAMNEHCWDERDGTFYSVDFALRPVDPADWLHRGAPRAWPCLLLRVDSWSSFLPMWAGFASQEQAQRMVERYRDRRTFHANYGVRSLSRLEKAYSVRASNNPSNWLGPIWGVANYLVFRGLLKYGFVEDARDLAEKTVTLLGRDLERNGSLHEYYHPDSGDPVMTRGFLSWNLLVLNMIAYLEGRPMVTEF
jgi:putative isomerase